MSRTAPFLTHAQVLEMVRGFEACTLPLAIWQKHQTHLIISAWYLMEFPEPEALERIRGGIQRYNRTQGIEMTPTSGYHETITLCWVHLILGFLAKASKEWSYPELVVRLVTELNDPRLLLRHYSADLLRTWEARCAWTPPDRAPLSPA